MPRETRICLMPQAICFNNSSSVICAVPLAIVAQIEHFIQNFTMTYLSFQQNCFRFAERFLFMVKQLYQTKRKESLILELPQFLLSFCKIS